MFDGRMSLAEVISLAKNPASRPFYHHYLPLMKLQIMTTNIIEQTVYTERL